MTERKLVSPQAQEDAEKLRSVVMPMEHEIAALKAKLTSAEERVKELEAAKVGFEEVKVTLSFYYCFSFLYSITGKMPDLTFLCSFWRIFLQINLYRL